MTAKVVNFVNHTKQNEAKSQFYLLYITKLHKLREARRLDFSNRKRGSVGIGQCRQRRLERVLHYR